MAKDDATEACDNGHLTSLCSVEQKRDHSQDLQQCQQKQICNTVPGRCGFGAKLCLPLLVTLGNGYKLHIQSTDGDLILFFQSTNGNPLPIDKCAFFGRGIGNAPTPIIIAGKNGVVFRHSGEINSNIAGFVSADHILPMGDGNLGAVGHGKPSPNFRFPAEGQ